MAVSPDSPHRLTNSRSTDPRSTASRVTASGAADPGLTGGGDDAPQASAGQEGGVDAGAPSGRHLVLVGGGYAHALLLRRWARRRPKGLALTLVTPLSHTPYSAMIPGWLAGHYRHEQLTMDMQALAAAAGAQWLRDTAVGLSADRRRLQLASGAELGYDLLSLNIGSTLDPPDAGRLAPGGRVLPMRPLIELRRRWEPLLADPALGATGLPPLRITAVGAGPAGIETLLAVCHRLRRLHPRRPVEPRLMARSHHLLSDWPEAAALKAQAALQRLGVRIELGRDFDDAAAAQTDLLLWATGAAPHRWPRRSGLAVDEEGFIRVDAQLRSVSHPEVYATGDCAAWRHAVPKSGQQVARMAPLLQANLEAAAFGRPGRAWRPRPHSLGLLATGERHAIASWGRWSLEGGWIWRWKDRQDRGFVAALAVGGR